MMYKDTKPQEPQHYFNVHNRKYEQQPQMSQMGVITNWFKRSVPRKRSIAELFEAAANGQCIIPSNYELDENNSMCFVSSSLLLIDVDDDQETTSPYDVLHALEGCCGLFYTFSHGIKGNRYRLVFQLDRAIRGDVELYKRVVEVVASEIMKQLPGAKGAIDTAAKVPLTPIRTGRKGALVKSYDVVLNTQHYIELANAEKARRAAERKERFESNVKVTYQFDELVQAANAIGYIPSGIGDTRWASLVMSIKSHVESGFITDEQGYELYAVISGQEASTKVWNGFKPNGTISIGAFIHHAKQCGFKFSRFAACTSDAESLEQFKPLPITHTSFPSYITTDYMKTLLEGKQRVLVKADTGSGKTRSTITAMKEVAQQLANDKVSRFCILSVPTVAITDQVAKDFNLLSVNGETKSLFKEIKNYVQQGNRVFVATYDMTKNLVTMLRAIQQGSGICLAIDEVHQLTSTYHYRRDAINSLYELSSTVSSLVGLTGTPDDVFRDIFDAEIHLKTHTKKPFNAPCQIFGAITYNEKKDEETKLLQLLQQKAESGKKLLVFIQNKDMIQRLFDNLKNRGIEAAKVVSDGKKNNPTYKSIVDESRFPGGVQVVLTTSVLSDGINILNETGEKYECIVVASNQSKLFNVDQARQMANRFRNLYGQFIIYMQAPKQTSEHLFNIEAAYRLKLLNANKIKTFLEAEFERNGELFVSDVVEKRYEFKANNQGVFEYNPLKVRHESATDKATFYGIYRAQFIGALAKSLGIKSSGMIDIDEALKDTDLSEIEADLQRMKEAAKLERDEKAATIRSVYTSRVYEVLQKKDVDDEAEKELLQAFKEATTNEHFSCLKGIVGIADYMTSLNVVQKVTKRANIHTFKYRIEALAHIRYYEAVARTNITKKVYTELLKYVGGTYTKDEQQQLVNSTAKKLRIAKLDDVQRIFSTFFAHIPGRNKHERFFTLEMLTVEAVANEYELDERFVVAAVQRYAEKQTKIFKNILQKKDDVYCAYLL